ncbi:diguanylate cyclase [Roseateles asaccharophilus]|uniref:diguanylate cyclase n=1 Tax=Roseateles asaccharophilus TaxID=582607 RepID=A0ABU2AH61_9BURK|nr:diguanylate cyclase [Roseateles asaccharophilus]MDR7335787.1 diguanylate cyclase (GGDEF)-like protein [Roseateles asaccharophilus]
MHPLIRGLLAPLVLLAGAAAAWADASPLEVQFRSVAVPMNSVPAVAQDKAGFMWVATSRGLTRYDGYRLRPIELARETTTQRNLGWVRAMAAGLDGRMWVGTETLGLAVYDPLADRVQALGSPSPKGGPHAPIRALAVDAEGDLWVGSVGQGLYRYRTESRRFEPQPLTVDGQPESRVLALRVGANGTVWAGHWQGLARLRPGQAWETLPLPAHDGLPAAATVLTLLETRGGRVWLGTQDGRLGVVDGGAVRWVQSLHTPVQALAEGPDGRLWVGTKTGLLWINPGSEAIEAKLTHDPRRTMGLAGNDISGLLRDRSGAMWVSGYGLGLQRHLFHPALAVRGPDLEVAGVLADADVRAVLTLASGDVLGATQQGQVVRLDGRRELQTLGQLARERRTVVEIMAEAADGSLWMAAAGRLEHRAANGRLLRDWPLDGGRAQRLLVRAGGDVWLGMQEGLYRLDGPEAAGLQRVALADGRPLHGAIHALIERPASHELWLGGQAGLFRVRDGRHPEPLPQAPAEALASQIVVALLAGRDGTVWVDTAISGLHRLAGWDAQGGARFERVSERLGLEGAFGGNLHEDGQGRIWSQIQVYDPRNQRVDGFGSAEGASFGSFWFFASTELPGGGLLFGGSRGLLRVLPEAFAAQPASPPLVISGLRVNGQPHEPPGADGLTLPAGTRSLGVEFAALDYADPTRLRYQYRLLGLDNDWTRVDASARNPSFGPLKPGRYVLQVKASAHQTLWGADQLELPIELLPAWWETTAARAGGVVLALAAIWGWMRWRTRLLRRREAELQALVDERTAELRELSLTDALTGLRNRRYLELRLDDDLRLCLRRFETPEYQKDGEGPGPDADLLLMVLDLDHFKRINDLHGHAAGDAVLVQLAERLRGVFRETDSLVRWGGEEVLVLVRETERRDAAALAERVCAAVREKPFDIGPGETVHVTVSIGFSAFPLDPRHPRLWDWRACLGLADSALYAAKAQGRDGYVGAIRAKGLSPRDTPQGLEAWQVETRLDVARSAVDDALTA